VATRVTFGSGCSRKPSLPIRQPSSAFENSARANWSTNIEGDAGCATAQGAINRAGLQGGSAPKLRAREDRISHSLTARDLEVLNLIAIARSNREIADQLYISPKTASVHVSNIPSKLGAQGRSEAAAEARPAGII